MNEDNGKVVQAEEKKAVSLEDRLAAARTRLDEKKALIKQIEQQMVQTQRQLQAAKDKALSEGIEAQGQVKLLEELLGVTGERTEEVQK